MFFLIELRFELNILIYLEIQASKHLHQLEEFLPTARSRNQSFPHTSRAPMNVSQSSFYIFLFIYMTFWVLTTI